MLVIERAARALCRTQGNPENIRFEGRAMWESYIPEARAVLDAIGFDGLLDALAPFALAIEHQPNRRCVDDAFIWEGVGDKPLVTYGALRRARDAIVQTEPALLKVD